MKFFKWAYDKKDTREILLTEYAISEGLSQAEALSRVYCEMIDMGVYIN